MSSNHRNGQYAYRRIQGVIRKRIELGKLRPGDVVESERELARIHKVSRGRKKDCVNGHRIEQTQTLTRRTNDDRSKAG
jgi:DNA-binding transcriptional MocR family regulator